MPAPVSIRLHKDQRTRAQKIADARRQSLSETCRQLIDQGLETERALADIRAEVHAAQERTDARLAKQAEDFAELLRILRAATGSGRG